jgi:hypothetical protein
LRQYLKLARVSVGVGDIGVVSGSGALLLLLRLRLREGRALDDDDDDLTRDDGPARDEIQCSHREGDTVPLLERPWRLSCVDCS